MASPESLSLSKLTLDSTQATSHQPEEPAYCPFFEVLPLEIRRKIYGYAFEGSVMHIIGLSPYYICASCGLRVPKSGNICCGQRLTQSRSSGPIAHNVLLTCSSIYYEARSILAASVEVRFSYCSEEILARFPDDIHKHTFLEFAAAHVKHVSANYQMCKFSTIVCKVFTGVQIMSFGSFPVWSLDFETLEDDQSGAEYVMLTRRMVKASASWLNLSAKNFRDDLHVHFHYHTSFQGSEYVGRQQNLALQTDALTHKIEACV